jgi:TonB family protein
MQRTTLRSLAACAALLVAGCASPAPSVRIADELAIAAYEEVLLDRLVLRPLSGFLGDGSGVVGFTLLPDGSVMDLSLIESSGSAALDARAVEIILLSAPFPPPPRQLRAERGIQVSIPFRFRLLERVQEQAA